ncbi:hypothetical protein CASFOL_042524 [Castilleja foliolosa]|uniref:Uncharacterized protein n=1 Tax=Castilleja foliolosa TaxID=1961234 RepID=A0ABD3B8L4_9LAMI
MSMEGYDCHCLNSSSNDLLCLDEQRNTKQNNPNFSKKKKKYEKMNVRKYKPVKGESSIYPNASLVGDDGNHKRKRKRSRKNDMKVEQVCNKISHLSDAADGIENGDKSEV